MLLISLGILIPATIKGALLRNGGLGMMIRQSDFAGIAVRRNNFQMTVDIYGHLIPNSNREAVNRLDFSPTIRNPNATAQNESGQVIENLPAFMSIVSKVGYKR